MKPIHMCTPLLKGLATGLIIQIVRTRDAKEMQGQGTHCDHVTGLRMRSKPMSCSCHARTSYCATIKSSSQGWIQDFKRRGGGQEGVVVVRVKRAKNFHGHAQLLNLINACTITTIANTALCIAFAWTNVLLLKMDVISELFRLRFMVCQTEYNPDRYAQ